MRGKARQASENDLAGDRGFHNTWSRGSPFQMPARLAVGLDLGSGRQRRSPVLLRPVFANLPRRVWVPRAAVLESSDFGCTENYAKRRRPVVKMSIGWPQGGLPIPDGNGRSPPSKPKVCRPRRALSRGRTDTPFHRQVLHSKTGSGSANLGTIFTNFRGGSDCRNTFPENLLGLFWDSRTPHFERLAPSIG